MVGCVSFGNIAASFIGLGRPYQLALPRRRDDGMQADIRSGAHSVIVEISSTGYAFVVPYPGSRTMK